METADRVTDSGEGPLPIPSRWTADLQALRAPLICLSVLTAVSLAVRPAIPVDETRYLSVAWEMWRSGDFLVPHLNGVPYPDKPPLLFWLIHAGWTLFGVQSWWPRLIPALATLATLFLTVHLGRALWPDRPQSSDLPGRAGAVLQGALLCAVLVTVLLFDPLLMACAALASYGLVRAARGGSEWRAWALVGVGIGLGILTKGPVVLVPVLPVALTGPWWAGPRSGAVGGGEGVRPLRWYAGVAAALAFGLLIAGAWAIPAASAGGPEYARAILVGQTAGRVTDSFAHQKPWWWYLPLLPVVLYPYSFWVPAYRAVPRLRRVLEEPGVRFAVAQIVPALVAFSLISGKQPQYLAPLLPAAALLFSRLVELGPAPRARDLVAPILFPLAVAGAMVLVPGFGARAGLPDWVDAISPGAGLLLGVGVVLAAVLVGRRARMPSRGLGGLSVGIVVALYLALSPVFAEPYDLRPVADRIALAEQRDRPVAHVGEYQGELHFLGRLHRPFFVLGAREVPAWLRRHPDGLVIAHYPGSGSTDLAVAELVHPSRGTILAVWSRQGLASVPSALTEALGGGAAHPTGR